MQRARALLFASQADVERRRLAAPDVDLRDVRPEALLAVLDRVRALGDVDDEAILSRRSTPWFAVDRDLGVHRLHADRKRAVARLRLLSSARTRALRRRRRHAPCDRTARLLRRWITWRRRHRRLTRLLRRRR